MSSVRFLNISIVALLTVICVIGISSTALISRNNEVINVINSKSDSALLDHVNLRFQRQAGYDDDSAEDSDEDDDENDAEQFQQSLLQQQEQQDLGESNENSEEDDYFDNDDEK